MISKTTEQQIKAILDRYLTVEKQRAMFKELLAVKGNKSFTDSIANLSKLINK